MTVGSFACPAPMRLGGCNGEAGARIKALAPACSAKLICVSNRQVPAALNSMCPAALPAGAGTHNDPALPSWEKSIRGAESAWPGRGDVLVKATYGVAAPGMVMPAPRERSLSEAPTEIADGTEPRSSIEARSGPA